jgi:nitroreductase
MLMQTIWERKSIRGFLSKPVEDELVKKVLEAALQAPSACNMQPWEFIVVRGKAKEELVNALISAYRQEKRPSRTQSPVPEKYKKRMQELFGAIKEYAEKTPGFDTWEGSLRFYNAPVVILVGKDKNIDNLRLLDIGLSVENLMLAAHALGLGTCPIALTLRYDDVIRQTLNLPSELELVLTVALGYPDLTLPINQFKAPKARLDECVKWID